MAGIQFEHTVPVVEARDGVTSEASTAALSAPPQPTRAALSRAGIEMMSRLPHPMLRYTADHFPHIVDRLASEWANPSRMARAIDDLIYDMRGGRAGFPMEVLSELGVLRERYERWVGPARMR
jgi:hypothetical protein